MIIRKAEEKDIRIELGSANREIRRIVRERIMHLAKRDAERHHDVGQRRCTEVRAVHEQQRRSACLCGGLPQQRHRLRGAG